MANLLLLSKGTLGDLAKQTDDVIEHRLAFLSKGEIPPDGLKPHTDLLEMLPHIGTSNSTKS